MRQILHHPVRVLWNPRMSTRRLNELLTTPNIHEDDEDAIMGELWLRDSFLPAFNASSPRFAAIMDSNGGRL